MARTDTKPKPKKKPKLSNKAQIERFKETARELGADETGKAFEDAFARIVPSRRAVDHSRPSGKRASS
jgi:hypothetical protein